MNKWLLSMILFLSFTVVLFINLQNNSEVGNQFSTNLEDVTNEEMEAVILENPNIFPMRVALANRYFDEVDYSNALPHYMYVAENSDESEIKSFALAQIAWMVFESGNSEVATNYLNESLNINNNSLIAKSYLGIIYLQDPTTKNEGLELLENILSSNKLSKEDRELIERLLLRYEN